MLKMSFNPRAQILLQLGEQLIKNENIAILELVKNAYDADAKNVVVNMQNIENKDCGCIEIYDDGWGMSLDIIKDIWMEPGNNHKKDIVKQKKRSALGRLPIGEKGIGRFGVHKLGKVIELVSRMDGRQEVVLNIDWSIFETAEYLSDVKIDIYERKPEIFKDNKTGTYIRINNLSTNWTRGMVRNLHRALTALNSPFESTQSFSVILKTNKQEWLKGLISFNDIKGYALFECDIKLSNSEMTWFKYSFQPYAIMEGIKNRETIFDNCVVMRKQIRKKGKKEIVDIDLSRYKIGNIRIKLYAFDRDSNILNKYITDKAAFKSYLDENGGISVFRDGMRILDYGEPDNDWLGLDLKRVNAPTKTLSNNIILGAVYLDRDGSEDLKEKANREGFIEDEAYLCFRDAVEFAIGQFTAQRNIDKENLRAALAGGSKEPVKEEISEVRKIISNSQIDKKVKMQLESSLSKVEKELEFLKQRYIKTANAGMSYGIVIHEIEKIIGELKIAVKEEGTSRKIKILSAHLSRVVDSYAELLRNKSKDTNNLKDIINQSLFSVEYRLNAHEISVLDDYSEYDGNVFVNCASNMVVGAIINIIDNSIYWTSYAKKPQRKIYIKLTEEIEGFLGIVIADNGTGFSISGDDAIKPFVSTKTNGLGLGLNIVNEIMLAQGGTVVFPQVGDIEMPKEFQNGAAIILAFAKEK